MHIIYLVSREICAYIYQYNLNIIIDIYLIHTLYIDIHVALVPIIG